MSQVASLTKAIQGLDKAIAKGTANAMNTAVLTAKANLVKNIQNATKLKQSDITDRIAVAKATPDYLNVVLAIATQFLIPLRKFSPILQKVMIIPKNRSKAQPYTGVSVDVGQGRELVDGGFALDNPSGLVVVGRQGNSKYPIQQLKTDVFQQAVTQASAQAQDDLQSTFDYYASLNIEQAIADKFNSD